MSRVPAHVHVHVCAVDRRAVARVPRPQNNRYEGQWQDDRRHGSGTFFHADGSRYEGEWVNGRKEGKGVLIL